MALNLAADDLQIEDAHRSDPSPIESSPAFVFGPVPSRRLGSSLGIDILPRKTCTLDCVYCELGVTDRRALRRMEYVPTDDVIEELRISLKSNPDVDTITFSGSGEPTLHSGLGTMITAAKKMSRIPVAVITNGTLLFMEDVRNDLLQADIVLPSLDAATHATFQAVNKPHPHLHLEEIIEGLVEFRKVYRGQIWLEILLVRGLNDTKEELSHLKEAVQRIRPDRLQLNTVVRPPALTSAQPVGQDELIAIRDFFGLPCEIIGSTMPEQRERADQLDSTRVLAMLRRRAMTLAELRLAIPVPLPSIIQSLGILEELDMIREFEYQQKKYFEAVEITHR